MFTIFLSSISFVLNIIFIIFLTGRLSIDDSNASCIHPATSQSVSNVCGNRKESQVACVGVYSAVYVFDVVVVIVVANVVSFFVLSHDHTVLFFLSLVVSVVALVLVSASVLPFRNGSG